MYTIIKHGRGFSQSDFMGYFFFIDVLWFKNKIRGEDGKKLCGWMTRFNRIQSKAIDDELKHLSVERAIQISGVGFLDCFF